MLLGLRLHTVALVIQSLDMRFFSFDRGVEVGDLLL